MKREIPCLTTAVSGLRRPFETGLLKIRTAPCQYPLIQARGKMPPGPKGPRRLGCPPVSSLSDRHAIAVAHVVAGRAGRAVTGQRSLQQHWAGHADEDQGCDGEHGPFPSQGGRGFGRRRCVWLLPLLSDSGSGSDIADGVLLGVEVYSSRARHDCHHPVPLDCLPVSRSLGLGRPRWPWVDFTGRIGCPFRGRPPPPSFGDHRRPDSGCTGRKWKG